MREEKKDSHEVTTHAFLKEILTTSNKSEPKSKVILIGENHGASQIREILISQFKLLKEQGCTIMLEGVPNSFNKLLADIAKTGKIRIGQRQTLLDKSKFIVFADFIFITLAAKYNIPVIGCETHETDPRLPQPTTILSFFSPSSPNISDEKFNEFVMQHRNMAGNISWGSQLKTFSTQNNRPIIFIGGREHIVGTKEGTTSMQTIVGENTVSITHNVHLFKQTQIKEKVAFQAVDDKDCQGIFDYALNAHKSEVAKERSKELSDDPKELTNVVVNQITYLLLSFKNDQSYIETLKKKNVETNLSKLIELFPASEIEQEFIKKAIYTNLTHPSAEQMIGSNIDVLHDMLHSIIDPMLQEKLWNLTTFSS